MNRSNSRRAVARAAARAAAWLVTAVLVHAPSARAADMPLTSGIVGVQLTTNADGRAVIGGIIPTGPAAVGGLKVGDIILDIDGTDVTADKVPGRTRGTPGTPVKLD